MKQTLTPYAMTLALLAGCSPQPLSRAEAAGATQFETLPVRELMVHVIDPAADGVWENQGWEYTAAGERETFPTTDEGWLQAANAAATVAESANLLLTAGRRREGDAWGQAAAALHKAGLDTFQAAEARDKQAFFDAGGRIYEACVACHERYVTSPAAPGAAKQK